MEIEQGGASTRVELRPGLTRVGGSGADFVIAGAPRGELHFWSDPPKLLYLGAGSPPRVGGRPIEEHGLSSGDRIEWAGARILYRSSAPAPALIEEIPLPPSALAEKSGAERAWTRVRAGMLVDLGLADARAQRRWQDAVLRGEFDADACARELIGESRLAADDPRLLERSARLLRDFLMTPLASGARGAVRRMRGAARSGTAFVVSQILVVLVYTAILGTMMVIARLKWGWSFDSFFDQVLGR